MTCPVDCHCPELGLNEAQVLKDRVRSIIDSKVDWSARYVRDSFGIVVPFIGYEYRSSLYSCETSSYHS